jgi:osmoprotectant transport system permease protein
MIDWLLDADHWQGSDGIPTLLLQHLRYSGISLLIALVIGLPIGFFVGHTGRGTFLIAGAANATRALPSLGLIVLLVILVGPYFKSDLAFLVPSIAVLVLIAIPPMMMGAYAGVASVDAAAVDAARGMGYRPLALLFAVEVPCALPLIFSGIRSAALQVVSTATIAAYVSLGGLGRLIIDGRAQNDYVQMAVGAILVGLLALLIDLVFGLASRFAVSPGLTRRTVKNAVLRRHPANENNGTARGKS